MAEPTNAESTEQRETGDEMLVRRGETPLQREDIHGQGESPQAKRQDNPDYDPNPTVPRTGPREQPVEEKGFVNS